MQTVQIKPPSYPLLIVAGAKGAVGSTLAAAGRKSLSYLLPVFREVGFDPQALLGASRQGNED